ncbi:helix-turn-helix transcriptional regulator [Clostridium botulinum]|uniref:helix-turn-helix transcriptional regulator n=1 Tax=Clostridium botulinum TaxID=1491 RepID=UPI00077340A5|nr:helix-turn-helix transcriptional regulator [Clostridium botulinum]MBN1067145.1 XRE family transcriptional regulator [Clostridium botulinum]NFE74414.1 helix-turn-helix transcriptional regulator [Clostridium botulinum]NFH79950.1 helix-turn-helix transcriptional regulator [Clostridium botulinum]NFH84465.1 helix-turn-helix transcriptional regulator [Clostridium botulinum]NFI11534.1 helix-turn-helix transcriptional regulator [Clostridium botulinum]
MKVDSKKEIGNLIKQARTRKNITQKYLADKCLISRNYISDIENGRYSPSVETLVNISKILNINLNLIKNVVNTPN